MAIIKNPQIIIKSDSGTAVANALVADVVSGTYIGMENAGQVQQFTGTSSQQLGTILQNLDLSNVQIQYRENSSSTAVAASGTLALYTSSTATFPDGTVFNPLFVFTPTNATLYADGLSTYIVDDVCTVTISDAT